MNHEERITRAERNSNWSLSIAIGAFCITMIQLIGDYCSIHYGKYEMYETASLMQLDSIQVSQNDKIIELLATTKRDTTIVHIVAPAY